MGNHDSIKQLVSKYSGQANIITIPRIYLDLLEGDYPAAALLNQIVYWSDKSKIPGGWFYHSRLEWLSELCLTYFQIKRATKKLLDNHWIECHVKRANGAPTTHYRVNMDNLTTAINKFLEIQETRNSRNSKFKKLNNRKLRNLTIHCQETSLSESKETQQSLTKITQRNNSEINSEITAAPPTPPINSDDGGGGGGQIFNDLISLGIHKNEINKLFDLGSEKSWTQEEILNEYRLILSDSSVTKPGQVLRYRILNCAPSPLPKKIVKKDPLEKKDFLSSPYAHLFKTGKE